MRIRTKISLLVLSLVLVVVGSIVSNLIWVEQHRVRREFTHQVDAMMEGVMRIGRESLSAQDELMLLSYLKFLMKDYPEIELAIISRQGHTSVLGNANTELFYRTLTITDWKSAQYKSVRGATTKTERRRGGNLSGHGKVWGLPNTFTIQIGFSKSALNRKIRKAQVKLVTKIFSIAGIGLLVGLIGSLWLGRVFAGRVIELADAADEIARGNLDTSVEVKGSDEIGHLGAQFNRMAVKIRDSIRFKEDLMATLSHELNTPLGGLKGFLEFLQDKGTKTNPKVRRESYQTMSEAVDQMEISLTNALQIFKTDAAPALNPERFRMRETLWEVVRLFIPAARSSQIVLEGPINSPPGYLIADRELTRRVVINLVSNALKYTPDGGRVKIRLEEGAGEVHISVADTGPGIREEDQERIFTKFYRVLEGGGGRERIPGSGLGLAIAKRAVELQGGRIWVESEPGKGSVFHVTWPKRSGRGREKHK